MEQGEQPPTITWGECQEIKDAFDRLVLKDPKFREFLIRDIADEYSGNWRFSDGAS